MTQACVQKRRLTGAGVLVVEDQWDLRACVVDLLACEGATVQDAPSGNAGFDAFCQRRPDVIVSDLWMPDGSGFDLIRRVRELPPERGGLTPAIAMSAGENLRRAIMAGFHAFFAKPFDLESLIATVADFVRCGVPHAVAPWTITREAGRLTVTFVGRVDAGDIRAMTSALAVHLDEGPVHLISDLRRLTDFAPSVASIAEREVWTRRKRITSVRVVGGSFAARLILAAAGRILGIPCSFSDSMGGSERQHS